MGIKLMLTGLVFSFLLTVPAIMKPHEPPIWVKAAVLLPGFVGMALIFIGALVAIWA